MDRIVLSVIGYLHSELDTPHLRPTRTSCEAGPGQQLNAIDAVG